MLVGTMSDDARILSAMMKPPAGAWKRVYWMARDRRDPMTTLYAYIEWAGEQIEAELRPALDKSSYAIDLVRGERRIDWGAQRGLANAKRYAWAAAVHTIATRWLLDGVPTRAALERYAFNLWIGRGPRTPMLIGRFVRSPAGTLRYSTDLRDFYEHLDELALWRFAPLSSEHGGIVPRWSELLAVEPPENG